MREWNLATVISQEDRPTFQIVKRGSTMFAGGNRWERELPDGHFDTKPTGRDIVYRVYALLDPPVWEIAECIDIE